MSLGKAIVTSTIGAEGILYENGKSILIADNPGDYVRQIRRCLEDKNFYEQLGKNARTAAEEQFGYLR
jgi:glycosyltransferase involved in cell wall biosynthesis